MKIVITNDDGYDQPGLAALHEAVRPLGEIVVVAPALPQSGVGHSITLHGGVYAERISADMYVVHGSPADCTRLALKIFAPDAEWVIAGINPGANLGIDVYPSGTVAAAREAAILGRKAMAVSQYIARDRIVDWSVTGYQAAALLPRLIEGRLSPREFWNVNLPHILDYGIVPDFQEANLEKMPHEFSFKRHSDRFSYTGSIHERPRCRGSDVDVCYSGKVALTRMEC